MSTATTVSSRLNYKRIATYFKKCGLTVYVERVENGEFLISDKLVMVKVLPDHEIALWTDFHDECKRVQFAAGKAPAMASSGPDMQQFWNERMAAEYHPLTLTRELREVPGGDKGKPGALWRKFTFEDKQLVQRNSWFNKQILDMFSPDLDELEGFQFEQVGTGPMRIAAVYGYVAIVMPGYNIEPRKE